MSEPHSKQFLIDARESWWNDDQLRAIAGRLELVEVRTAADVGCGQGHWTRLVAALLPATATITGIDREPEWIAIAEARGGARYQVGTAEQLPFADRSLDLVTAQTVLIHVADPPAVLREMARVLRPGGKLWLLEPNNLVASVSLFADPKADPDLLGAAFRLELVAQRGKHALGLGYNSLGEKLVGLLDPAMWQDLDVRLCDRVHFAAPPYRPGLIDDVKASQGEPPIITWPREETLRYFLAGGGQAAQFDALWDASVVLLRERQRAILAGEYAAAEGMLFYSTTATRCT
ncbi:MAG TPA: class I SAM-dependent methyltransferase [Kofleriaceae bacterium]